jgi:hypothetical protein
MSRQDYQMIADVIKSTAYDPAIKDLSQASLLKLVSLKLAIEMKSRNHAFKEEKFVNACGFNF